MKHVIFAFSIAATFTAAVPALAGVGAVDLPRLTFPEPSSPDVGQGCASPATLSTAHCDGNGS